MNLINNDSNTNGIFRAYMIHTKEETRVYIPGAQNNPLNANGSLNTESFEKYKTVYPKAVWCSKTMQEAVPDTTQPCWVTYEGGDSKRPIIMGFLGNGLLAANAWFGSSIGSSGNGGSGIYLNKKYDKYILIGDSRGVGMYNTIADKNNKSAEINKVVDNTHWICKGGAAYDWMLSAFSSAESSIIENSVVVNMMGFNNCSPKSGSSPNNGPKYYAPKYAEAINEKVSAWKEKGADIVFCSVNAMHDDNYISSTKDLGYRNSEVILFNDTIKPLLSSDVTWLDTYTLTYADITGSNGPSDGIHYGGDVQKKVYNAIMGVGNSNIDYSTWCYPLDSKHTLDPTTDGRAFGAPRSNGTRAHAGIDLIVSPNVNVIACTSGEVDYISYDFFAGTDAIIIKNDDGSWITYGECKPDVSVGDKIKKGQKIGHIIANDSTGSSMLHFEVYAGDSTGNVLNANGSYKHVPEKVYKRRCDLCDPTFVVNLPMYTG